MRSARRPRLVPAVALAAGVLGLMLVLAPYGFGLRVHTIVTTLADQLAHEWHLPVVTTRYQRGWFSSAAEMFLAVSPEMRDLWRTYLPRTADAQGTPAGVSIVHHVLHGPFPFASRPNGSGVLVPVQALLTTTLRPAAPGHLSSPTPVEVIPVLHVNTTVLLSGASQSRFIIPAFTAPLGEAALFRLVWEGLRGEVSLAERGRHLLGALHLPGMQFERDNARMSLRHLLSRIEAVHGRHQPLQGKLAVSLDTLEVVPETAAQATWAVQGGSLRASVNITGETMQSEIDLQCDTCRLEPVDYTQSTAHLDIHRLHLPTLLRLGQEVLVRWLEEPDSTVLWSRWLFSGELARLLASMARTNPVMALTQARLRTSDGEIHLTARVSLDGERVLYPGYFPQVLQSIDAAAGLEAPVTWVQAIAVIQAANIIRERSALGAFLPSRLLHSLATTAADRAIHHLVEQGLLSQEGAMYKSKARYTDGQLWVNERPVALPPLVQ